jgi:polyphosphate kinase 2 (PPK2 family)
MPITLSDYEAGGKYPGDYDKDLKALQERLSRILVSHIVHKRRTAIVFEGWDAAGKGGAIQRLTSGWDPRAFKVWPIAAPTAEEKARHFLWRFWTRLPGKAKSRCSTVAGTAVCWWSGWRASPARANGAAAMTRSTSSKRSNAYDGTQIIKIFLHISQRRRTSA